MHQNMHFETPKLETVRPQN